MNAPSHSDAKASFRPIRHIDGLHPVTVYESAEDAMRRLDGGEYWEAQRERLLKSFGPHRRLRQIVYRQLYLGGKYGD